MKWTLNLPKVQFPKHPGCKKENATLGDENSWKTTKSQP